VPHLLFLEKQLTDLHSFVSKLPTLDPTAEWVLNEDTGLRETPRVQTHRTQKVTSSRSSSRPPTSTQPKWPKTRETKWSATGARCVCPARCRSPRSARC
jgi:hypothetical protein